MSTHNDPSAGSPPLAVLVIDDDPAVRGLLLDALTQEHRVVVAVESAEEGLAQLPYHEFAVAFVDHRLPAMDGLTLCGYLRRASPLLEVVLVTGEESRSLRHQVQEEGLRFLPKPLVLDDVLQLVAEQEQQLRRRATDPAPDPYLHPRLDEGLLDEVALELGLPPAPERLREALTLRLKEAARQLRSRTLPQERDRVLLFSGIVACRLLGIPLPTVPDGRSLAEEYDRLMLRQGRATAFTPPAPATPPAPRRPAR